MRQTCFVTSNHGLFLHSVSTHGTKDAKAILLELTASASPVIHLSLSRAEGENTITVLQRDGTITFVTGNLTSVKHARVALQHGTVTGILDGNILDSDAANKTVLKARFDLSSSLPNDSKVCILLSEVEHPETSAKAIVYAAFSANLRNERTAATLTVSPLFEHDLTRLTPALARSSSDITGFFGLRNTTVNLRSQHSLFRFDLQHATPRPLPSVSQAVIGAVDMTELSPSHIIVSFDTSLRIVDTNYSTIQASVQRPQKRNSKNVMISHHTRFVAYFGHINRIIASTGPRLVAIDVTIHSSDEGVRIPESTLARNIGRGTEHSSLAVSLKSMEVAIGGLTDTYSLPKGWREVLDDLIQKNDTKGLEAVLFKSYGQSGHNSTSLDLPDDVAVFLLSKMFIQPARDAVSGNEAPLRLEFKAPRLLKALNAAGLLRVDVLRKALKRTPAQFEYDDIILAICNIDQSLSLLRGFVEGCRSPDAVDQAMLLRFLIQKALAQDNKSQQPKLMTAESTEAMEEQAVSGAPTVDREPASATLERSLVEAVDSLGQRDMSELSSTFRRVFSLQEVLGIVQFLRQQLFRAGHTGSLLAAKPLLKGAKYVSLSAAVKILSACVDAIGPLEMLGAAIEDDFVQRVIPDLLSEITLATQYVEESTDLQGLLRETLRYAESQQPIRAHKALPTAGGPDRKRGEIVTLYAQRTEDEVISGVPGALPLSLRAEEVVKTTKTRDGRKKQRSDREMRLLESRQTGPYTLERLFL
jgi:hypothetical protein